VPAQSVSQCCTLQRRDYLQIAALSGVDPRTVAAYYQRTKEPLPATKTVIRLALRELNLPDREGQP
jgi:hypothetical protein